MEGDVSLQEVVEMMRTTRKNDPLFKPLKKVKTALESIDAESIAYHPTEKMVLFHFGLGNDLDQDIIASTQPKGLAAPISITPGHSYCTLCFQQAEMAAEYIGGMSSLPGRPLYYRYVQYHNLTRLIVGFFWEGKQLGGAEQNKIPDCPSHYQEGTVPGLHIEEELISKEEQIQLMHQIDSGGWQRLNNRRVQHYGYEFKYGRNQIDPQQQHTPIPPYFRPLLQTLNRIPQLAHSHFDQLTINDYFAGNGIPPHFDTHSPFEEIFVSVSLLSPIVMELRKYNGVEESVYLRPRSVAIFSGEARYAWTHGIACRKMDKVGGDMKGRSRRISLTFRQIRRQPCKCPYYFYCDGQGYDQSTMKKQNPLLSRWMSEQHASTLLQHPPNQIERRFVEQAYNGFGFHFHNRVIEEVRGMLSKVEAGQWVLDVGNGNGEYLKHLKEGVEYWGVERCKNMVGKHNQLHMDGRKLCVRSGVFDRVLLVAVLHHMASLPTRLEVLSEAYRVIRSGGTLYLSVLSYEHKKEMYVSQQTLLEYTLPSHDIPTQPNPLPFQPPRIQQKGQVYQRYYHLFTQPQLIQLLQQSNFHIEQLISTKDNLIVRATKLPTP